MLVLNNFILSLGFHSQDNYLPKDRKDYKSFHSMIDPTVIVLIWIFTQIQKRADMTSWLIGLGLSDHPSSPVRAKVECSESDKIFSCQVIDCSATRILFSSITGCHSQPTGSLIVFFFTPLQSCSWHILQPQPTGWSPFLTILINHSIWKCWKKIKQARLINLTKNWNRIKIKKYNTNIVTKILDNSKYMLRKNSLNIKWLKSIKSVWIMILINLSIKLIPYQHTLMLVLTTPHP